MHTEAKKTPSEARVESLTVEKTTEDNASRTLQSVDEFAHRVERIELINAVREAFDWFLSSGSYRIANSDSLKDRLYVRILRSLVVTRTSKYLLSNSNLPNASELAEQLLNTMQLLKVVDT